MGFQLQSFVENLQGIASVDAYWDCCNRAFKEYGIGGVLYGVVPLINDAREHGNTQATFFRHTYPTEWLDAFGEDEILDNDISVDHTMAKLEEFVWQDDTHWDDATVEQIEQNAVENDLLMRTGVSFALASPRNDGVASGIGIWTRDVPEHDFHYFWDSERSTVRRIAHLLDEGMRGKFAGEIVSLSDRERDALTYFSLGYRAAEVAHKFQISPKTLEKYVHSAKRKLKARTRDHAISKALLVGAIRP